MPRELADVEKVLLYKHLICKWKFKRCSINFERLFLLYQHRYPWGNNSTGLLFNNEAIIRQQPGGTSSSDKSMWYLYKIFIQE